MLGNYTLGTTQLGSLLEGTFSTVVTIDSDVRILAPISNQTESAYNIKSGQTQTQSTLYMIKSELSNNSLNISYSVKYPVIGSEIPSKYEINSPSTDIKDSAYNIKTTPTYSISSCYKIVCAIMLPTKYSINNQYSIVSDTSYNINNPKIVNKNTRYLILSEQLDQKDITYRIKYPTTPITEPVQYKVKSTKSVSPVNTKYNIATNVTVQRNSNYSIKTGITNSKDSEYLVKSIETINSNSRYSIIKINSYDKPSNYTIKTIHSESIDSKYSINIGNTIEIPSEYQVRKVAQQNISLRANGDISIQKNNIRSKPSQIIKPKSFN